MQGPAASAGRTDTPLSGVLVVSFEQAVAAPYCTRLLADLGARVIKVEQPGTGDFARHFDDVVDGLSAHLVWLNRGKESLTLDCKQPAARPVLDRLLGRADVVVQNLAPGAAQRLGVDAETLVAQRPHLVALDMSGYGVGGPLEHRRAYDLLAQAEAGSCSTTGWPGQPAKPGIPVADVGSGAHAAISVLAALMGRAASGRGAAIHVDLFDTVVDLLGFAMLHARYTGTDRPPNGMNSIVVAPYGSYPTGDGRTVVIGTSNDGEWQRLARNLLDRADLADDPGLATNMQRCEQRDRLNEAITTWTSTLDADEICARADAANIGSAVLNPVTAVVEHPQLTERGRWQVLESPVGPVSTLLPPFSCASWANPAGPVPGLGEHTAAILEELGFAADTYDSLRAAGAA